MAPPGIVCPDGWEWSEGGTDEDGKPFGPSCVPAANACKEGEYWNGPKGQCAKRAGGVPTFAVIVVVGLVMFYLLNK